MTSTGSILKLNARVVMIQILAFFVCYGILGLNGRAVGSIAALLPLLWSFRVRERLYTGVAVASASAILIFAQFANEGLRRHGVFVLDLALGVLCLAMLYMVVCDARRSGAKEPLWLLFVQGLPLAVGVFMVGHLHSGGSFFGGPLNGSAYTPPPRDSREAAESFYILESHGILACGVGLNTSHERRYRMRSHVPWRISTTFFLLQLAILIVYYCYYRVGYTGPGFARLALVAFCLIPFLGAFFIYSAEPIAPNVACQAGFGVAGLWLLLASHAAPDSEKAQAGVLFLLFVLAFAFLTVSTQKRDGAEEPRLLLGIESLPLGFGSLFGGVLVLGWMLYCRLNKRYTAS